MRGNFRNILYFIGSTCIIILIISLFFSMLPYILLVGVIAYLLIKLISFIKGRKDKLNENARKNKNVYENNNEFTYDSNDDLVGDIIDVEYEEVDKDKK
ncbi:hypothetical protein NE172_08735 [Clostridium botulinum]|uniref:Uncharacterized protein n=1 Tax=Clostridium botulinum TaxID=1491 RepID=A0A6B4JMU5_CLOBO|nr:hypothetical protein [Clostridium botulinum]EES47880.1 hypothetical protein CLO_2774 [Clostridium botulinum E1 str. 'BoNT E Beluga']MBY6761518.1 hypothetical protein [Clostridium botulinum]MBY6920150.1 hypothetical protein [Clostridium botulinum]MCR1131041.1 hypothetical protein [Clostridium botulinum]NFJ58141.1 hypothetical protein [Clostridium botulinum]